MKENIGRYKLLKSLYLLMERIIIFNQRTKKILLTASFLFLIVSTFLPIASAQKAIILNFDDDWKGQILHAVPILEKYGFKATFFVTCGCLTYQNSSFCNNAGGDSAMTWDDIALLSELGHDIQSHGMSHKDVTQLSATSLEYEIGESKKCLLEHDINPTVFGTPYAAGEGNSTVVNTISRYYEMGRMGYGPLIHLDLTNRYSLPLLTDYRQQAMYRDDSTKILDIFIGAVNNQTRFNTKGTINAIPIIVYHNVDYKNSSSNISPDWIDSTIDVNLFDREMKYLHDNGFQVLTMSDLGYNQTSNKLYIKNNSDDNFSG
jgi:peptidoglycan/xylan/chitin deacetylase (PgdA/CDA1 family)